MGCTGDHGQQGSDRQRVLVDRKRSKRVAETIRFCCNVSPLSNCSYTQRVQIMMCRFFFVGTCLGMLMLSVSGCGKADGTKVIVPDNQELVQMEIESEEARRANDNEDR